MVWDNQLPPYCFGWRAGKGLGQARLRRLRNEMAMRALAGLASPLFKVVNQYRRAWGIEPLKEWTDALSTVAQIAQLPEALEFPVANKPEWLHYTGPFVDRQVREPVAFPWERLDGRPLVYGSMGTLQNGSEKMFRTIAEACTGLDVQLVLSMGGGREPSELGELPGKPIVVQYAPQLELVRRAAVVVTHAGLNTTLESLAEGVPLVAIPMGNDQPGVAARIAYRGAGIVLPLRRLSAVRLRQAIDEVLREAKYRAAARRLQAAIREADGLERAAHLIEDALGLADGGVEEDRKYA